jgi:hypothetical protein
VVPVKRIIANGAIKKIQQQHEWIEKIKNSNSSSTVSAKIKILN